MDAMAGPFDPQDSTGRPEACCLCSDALAHDRAEGRLTSDEETGTLKPAKDAAPVVAIKHSEVVNDGRVNHGLGISPRVGLEHIPLGVHDPGLDPTSAQVELAPWSELSQHGCPPDFIGHVRDVEGWILQHQASGEVCAIRRDDGRRDRAHRVTEEQGVADAELVEEGGDIIGEAPDAEVVADATGLPVTTSVRNYDVEIPGQRVNDAGPARRVIR
jgi:hypothetical protein